MGPNPGPLNFKVISHLLTGWPVLTFSPLHSNTLGVDALQSQLQSLLPYQQPALCSMTLPLFSSKEPLNLRLAGWIAPTSKWSRRDAVQRVSLGLTMPFNFHARPLGILRSRGPKKSRLASLRRRDHMERPAQRTTRPTTRHVREAQSWAQQKKLPAEPCSDCQHAQSWTRKWLLVSVFKFGAVCQHSDVTDSPPRSNIPHEAASDERRHESPYH